MKFTEIFSVDLIDNMTAMVQIMAWRPIDDQPLSEAMFVCCTDAYMHHSASMIYVIARQENSEYLSTSLSKKEKLIHQVLNNANTFRQ